MARGRLWGTVARRRGVRRGGRADVAGGRRPPSADRSADDVDAETEAESEGPEDGERRPDDSRQAGAFTAPVAKLPRGAAQPKVCAAVRRADDEDGVRMLGRSRVRLGSEPIPQPVLLRSDEHRLERRVESPKQLVYLPVERL